MKIVGLTQRGYLCEISSEDADCLVGTNAVGHHNRERQIGREFRLYDGWLAIKGLREKVKELQSAADKLRCLAELLHPIAVEVSNLVEPPQPKAEPNDDF